MGISLNKLSELWLLLLFRVLIRNTELHIIFPLNKQIHIRNHYKKYLEKGKSCYWSGNSDIIFLRYEQYPSFLDIFSKAMSEYIFSIQIIPFTSLREGKGKPPACMNLISLDWEASSRLVGRDLRGWPVDYMGLDSFAGCSLLQLPLSVHWALDILHLLSRSFLTNNNRCFTNQEIVHTTQATKTIESFTLCEAQSPLCWGLAKGKILFLLHTDRSKSGLMPYVFWGIGWACAQGPLRTWEMEDFVLASFFRRVLELEKRIRVIKLAP